MVLIDTANIVAGVIAVSLTTFAGWWDHRSKRLAIERILDRVADVDYESHYHVCPREECGAVWAHNRSDIPEGGSEKAHTCPACGKGKDWWAKSARELKVVQI